MAVVTSLNPIPLTLPMAKARGFLLHPSLHLRSEERQRLT